MCPKGARNTLGQVGLSVFVVVLSLCVFAAVHAATDPCRERSEAHIAVDLSSHSLFLCTGGKAQGPPHDVRIGHNGVGKEREGDGKTPLGTYALGKVRHSKRYGWFIPIGYPTAEQKRKGYTGGAVGIHGPDRRVAWLGRVVNWFDTTDGCVGLAYDEEVTAIGAWVARTGAERIRLF